MKANLVAASLFSLFTFAAPAFASSAAPILEEWDDPKSPAECGLRGVIVITPPAAQSTQPDKAKPAKVDTRAPAQPTKVASARR